ncbi:Integrase catalytic domain-containing protein [Aphis craccivora]|uniref:Integrase catalytic domain-containing protein n=1 Tax=Aphis craccivora TaxID=307492 RepID=A0A6G0YIC4_APHCR|nr:Integrase catalytic domain-containing protein [Aphis craccivora]
MRELKLRKFQNYDVYIAAFVCFSIKAVHLEVVSELSTDDFLAAFGRFIGRRGLPCEVYSDCGMNFIGAD